MDLSTFDHCLWGKFFIPIWEIPEVKTLLFHSVNEMTGKAYFCLFLQIWTLAMTQHNKYGELLYSVGTDKYAMKEKDIAREIGTDLNFLMDALSILVKLGLVKKDGDIYYVPLAPKSFNYEALEISREKARIRQQKHRDKVKLVTRDIMSDVTYNNKSKSKNKNIVTTNSKVTTNNQVIIYNNNTINKKINKEITAAFIKFGILPNIQQIILNEYSESRILECITAISQKENVRNPSGMFLTMLREEWPANESIKNTVKKILSQKFCYQCSHSEPQENWLCNRNGFRWDYNLQKFVDCEFCRVEKNG